MANWGSYLPLIKNDSLLAVGTAVSDAAGTFTDELTAAGGELGSTIFDVKQNGVSFGQGRANGRGIQSPQILAYPMPSPITAQGHYVVFEIHRHQPGRIEITSGAGTSAIGGGPQARAREEKAEQQLADEIAVQAGAISRAESGYNKRRSFQLRNQTKTVETMIALYMPPSVSVNYNSSYADEDIGMIAEGGFNFIAQVMAGGVGGANLMKATAAGAGTLMEAGRRAIIQGADALAPGVKALANITAGSVISSKMELMFEKVQRRQFNYTFVFIPKSQKEAQMVDQIVFEFKRAMLPNYGEAGHFGSNQFSNDRTLTIPTTFDIKYMNIGNDGFGGPNTFLNKVSTCFCTSAQVNYGGDRFTAYRPTNTTRNVSSKAGEGAGNGFGLPPQRTSLTLGFSELEIITQESIDMGY